MITNLDSELRGAPGIQYWGMRQSCSMFKRSMSMKAAPVSTSIKKARWFSHVLVTLTRMPVRFSPVLGSEPVKWPNQEKFQKKSSLKKDHFGMTRTWLFLLRVTRWGSSEDIISFPFKVNIALSESRPGPGGRFDSCSLMMCRLRQPGMRPKAGPVLPEAAFGPACDFWKPINLTSKFDFEYYWLYSTYFGHWFYK